MNNEFKDLWRIWVAAFLYTCIVSAFIQFILLPVFLPDLHAGGGLFIGLPDCLGFYRLAAELAEKIRTFGWAAWEFRPQGQAPAGIAAFIFALTWSKLWILIPLNAVLHASAFLVLFQILNRFIKNQARALLCALPFLLFPSSLQWTSQLHKDGFSILGFLLFLKGIVLLSRAEGMGAKQQFYHFFRGLLSSICGIMLMWIVRPYLLTIVGPFIIMLFCFLSFVFLIKKLRSETSWLKIFFFFLSFFLMLFILLQEKSLSSIDFKGDFVGSEEIKAENETLMKHGGSENYWQGSFRLPDFIERKASSLSQVRKGFQFSPSEAKSSIDQNIGFRSVKDIVVYLPRATQIALLAPFPNQWFAQSSSPGGSFMRKISAFEMMVVYFALIFLPYAIWHWRKRIDFWIILLFCIYMMLVYGLVFCNIGSLYRMRYGYISILVALGIAGFIVFFEKLKAKRSK